MGFMDKILIIIGISIPIWAFISISKYKRLQKNEIKAYETMLLSPSDTTVLQYIPIFLSSYPNTTTQWGVGNTPITNTPQEHMAKKSRQAQGYQIISQSPNVSDTVKEQLRKAFVSKGVPIQ